jgi:hypothetical protein
MYLNSYKYVFNPMPAQHGWTKTNTVEILPPAFKDHLKGRRQEKKEGKSNLRLPNLKRHQECP